MTHATLRTALAICVLALAAACGGGEAPAPEPPAAQQAAAPPAAAAGSASIRGVATYQNGDPDAAIAMDADPVCTSLHTEPVLTEKVVTDAEGRLANVFVYVKQGAPSGQAPPGESHLLDQLGCQYKPHVSGMMVGQNLVIRNSDATLHNVHALPKVNAEFNRGQPFEGMTLDHKFDKPEVMIRFKCDVHPWMSSYMGVLDHPFFAVSGADGSFAIEGLPAGEYVIEAWHEELGTQTQTLTVGDGESAQADFAFAPAA